MHKVKLHVNNTICIVFQLVIKYPHTPTKLLRILFVFIGDYDINIYFNINQIEL